MYRYTTLLTQPIQQINHQVQDLQQAGAALLRIRDLLAVESHVRDTGRVALPTGALAVEFESVSFRYVAPAADQNAQPPWGLEGISFSLAPGCVLGLLGHTGSGKSSLIRLLFRLYEPTVGSIRLGGVNLHDVRLVELRRRVGMVTQEVQLFHASLRDNLTLFDAGIADDRILAVLEQIGLGDWYRTLPDGLATTLSSRSSGLSAGQAQLLAVARVFLKDPDVVILDEASSRLDPATEALLERAIDTLLEDRTAIVIAHRLTTVRRADHIMILDNGRCVEFGHYERLARDPHSRFSSLLRTALAQAPPKT
ncbi:MAG TPA: ABC transporter ATP-binding protein [Ardenticatenaceae bacterium]|nr:ABC transporter ATP-binding protein [Ardenticatenaceae bacterium]